MIFTEENAQKILRGEKTMTRRIVKESEDGTFIPGGELRMYPNGKLSVMKNGKAITDKRRIKWQVGRTYAIQPGRGKKAIGRFKLLGIKREKLQDISDEDCILEGITSKERWQDVLGPDGFYFENYLFLREAFQNLWQSIHGPGSWRKNPDVWVLKFEVVKNE